MKIKEALRYFLMDGDERKAIRDRISQAIRERQPPMRFPSSGIGGSWTGQMMSLSGFDQMGNPVWGPTYAGTQLNYTALVGDPLQSSLLMAPVKWVGRTLPEARLYVGTDDENGVQQKRDFTHPLTTLLNYPNSFYGGKQLWKAFGCSWVLNGNVYFWKRRNLKGNVAELWYLPHFLVYPHWPPDGTSFIDYYIYEAGSGGQFRIPVEDMIHFRDGLDPRNMRLGLSGIGSILREVFSDNERANFEAAILKNYGMTSLLIAPSSEEVEIDFDDAKVIKENISRQMTGDQRGKVTVATSAVTPHKLGFDPKELDLSALNKIPESRVSAVTGINGIVLNFQSAWERSIYNNVSEAREEAYESYLSPLQDYIGDEFDTQLLPEFEESDLMHVRWDRSTVRALQDDRDKLFKRVDIAYRGQWIDKAEARGGTGYDVRPEDHGVFWTAPAVEATQLQLGIQPTGIAPSNGSPNAPPKPIAPPKTKAKPAPVKLDQSDMDEAADDWKERTRQMGIPDAAPLIDARPKPNGGA